MLLKMNSLIISLYEINDDVVAQHKPPHNDSTYPSVIHIENKLTPIGI